MGKAIDFVMIGLFLVGIVNLFTGFAGVYGVVGLGFAVTYAFVVYGVGAIRKLLGI